jgi:hypothetical protein
VRGAVVDIALQVQDIEAAPEAVNRASVGVVERIRDQPCVLRGFRTVDLNGCYWE